MKDHRLQGGSIKDLAALVRKFPYAYPLGGRLECHHCGDKAAWFYVFSDMLVCTRCQARHLTSIPYKLVKSTTNRIPCKCKDYRKAVWGQKMSCLRCGTQVAWEKIHLTIQPLFDTLPEFQG